jgi:para-aminobenzoate synthetase component 1
MFSVPVAFLRTNPSKSILAFGRGDRLSLIDSLKDVDRFLSKHDESYVFSYLSYDLKNRIEKLDSKHTDLLKFPEIVLWKPSCVVEIAGTKITFLQGEQDAENKEFISEFLAGLHTDSVRPRIHFQPRISKIEYLGAVKEILHEIQQGNVYEMNFCQEYFATQVPAFDSFSVIQSLFDISKAPFSAYLCMDDLEVFCASPERYIQKVDRHLISQPIKGTIRRGENPSEDEHLKEQLRNDPKERSENVMITDLVRNDFSRIAEKNSVNVDELFGIYTFETVHHMISTISCELKSSVTFSEILEATFPMGSMTGAPKIAAMELIEKYEAFKRGLYSGSIGYFSPLGKGKQHDFDFNVVIRSLLYNRSEKYLSCSVGSAITIQSNPEREYEECSVKIQKILQLFGDGIKS